MKKPSEKKIVRGVTKLLKVSLRKILNHPSLTKDQFESAFNLLLIKTSTKYADFRLCREFVLHKYFDNVNMERLLCHNFYYNLNYYTSNSRKWMYNDFLVYAYHNHNELYLKYKGQFSYSFLRNWNGKRDRTDKEILVDVESRSVCFFKKKPSKVVNPDSLLELLDTSNSWINENKALALVSNDQNFRVYSTLYLVNKHE